jgi:hypothetical protein
MSLIRNRRGFLGAPDDRLVARPNSASDHGDLVTKKRPTLRLKRAGLSDVLDRGSVGSAVKQFARGLVLQRKAPPKRGQEVQSKDRTWGPTCNKPHPFTLACQHVRIGAAGNATRSRERLQTLDREKAPLRGAGLE